MDSGIIAGVSTPHQRAEEYDYIVVGSGTAGCIVAARLLEHGGGSVALLEAGGPYRRILNLPLIGLWAWLRHPERYCWNQHTTPQAALAGRRVWFPGGRIAGGSSAINAMIYTRGHPASYERWGVPGWGYDDLLPYHLRAEDHERGASRFHGSGGPIGVSESRHRFDLADSFIQGCSAAGIPATHDFNGARSDGAGYYQLTQRGGLRSSTGNTFLPRARRHPGFHHETCSLVTRLLVERGHAVGVVCRRHGRERLLRATREVIVSAGTVRSPQLLMLSGIGPADALRRLGIGVMADRPGVGAGLQDQVRVPIPYRHRRGWPSRPDRLIAAGLGFLTGRRGLLASNVCDVAAVVCTGAGDTPDVRVALRWRVFPEAGVPLVDFEVATLQPMSRGQVTLQSSDPVDPPAIDPGYLSEPSDRDAVERGIALARRIAASSALRTAGLGDEYLPGPRPVADHVRQHAESAYHPVGTCRMGVDDASVVDPGLRVRGIEGLRVVDASVIPCCVSANAQASVMAIAEKASDLIAGTEHHRVG